MGKMALVLFIAAALPSGASAGSPKITAYRLPITRDGKTVTRLSYDFWSGEQPAPVIDLNSAAKGSTKVSAYASLRTLDKKVGCTIKNGVYHPQARTANSAKAYYTITPVVEYEATKSVTLEGDWTAALHPGDKVVDLIPLGEGQCRFTVVQGKTRRDIEMVACETPDATPGLKRVAPAEKYSEQWIYLTCAEGYPAFIRDQGLLAAPGAHEKTAMPGPNPDGPHD